MIYLRIRGRFPTSSARILVPRLPIFCLARKLSFLARIPLHGRMATGPTRVYMYTRVRHTPCRGRGCPPRVPPPPPRPPLARPQVRPLSAGLALCGLVQFFLVVTGVQVRAGGHGSFAGGRH